MLVLAANTGARATGPRRRRDHNSDSAGVSSLRRRRRRSFSEDRLKNSVIVEPRKYDPRTRPVCPLRKAGRISQPPRLSGVCDSFNGIGRKAFTGRKKTKETREGNNRSALSIDKFNLFFFRLPSPSFPPVKDYLGSFLKIRASSSQHFLDPVLGHEDVGHRHLELSSGVDSGKSLDYGELERLPGRGLDSLLDAMHRQLEQLRVEGILDLAFQIGLGRGRVSDQLDRPRVPAGVFALGGEEIAPRVFGHGLQPGTEAARDRTGTCEARRTA